MSWQHTISEVSTNVLRKHQAPLPLKELAWKAVAFASRCRRSNPLSFALRPIFAHKRIHTAIGTFMALIVAALATISPFTSFAGENTGGPITINVLPEGEIPLTTNQSVVLPIDTFHISQGYNVFHPGLDMAGPIGEAINPVMSGTVTEVVKERFGYGEHVRVTHDNNYETLYAHMSEIDVQPGDKVTTTSKLGELGSTGRSTGPHLHLEVRDDSGLTINPKTFLDIK